MDKKDDDNPLVKTNTDEDNVLQSSNVHIEMSSNVNCGNKDKDKKVPNSTSQNDEEMFLLQSSSGSGSENRGTEDSVSPPNSESVLFPATPVSSTSSSDSVCRICQLAGKETGEEIKTTECLCRGNMSSVHQSCLRQWVYYKGSNKCEICHGRFSAITPPSTPGILQREALQNLTWQIERGRPFNRRKRAIMTAVIVFLVIVTCVTAMLTVSADREFERLSSNPWVTQDQVNNSNIIFSICIAFSFFCATMTIGLIIIWFGMECCFIMHRRGILRRATSTLLRNDSV
ncbi:Hypothetical predicted protein [Mytilus galloprovincialis]|uniref:RING-CH-type domain-containing protein n=1 Tax=Mytilus galloprovincialis TaxID=29158 RepID=A0A8B6EMX6_MYTGA|nr:Hypothetical predicted protein [Mytilus galloprovincialis]